MATDPDFDQPDLLEVETTEPSSEAKPEEESKSKDEEEGKNKKGRFAEAMNVYNVMLTISLIAFILATLAMFMELQSYNFEISPPENVQLVPDLSKDIARV